ncbi:MAG: ATP-dependent helicase [Bilifractor sp.]|jgi:DNA helicase-2/ATP-dependent DNA helicase PcrA
MSCNYLDYLNEPQQEAVRCTEGPLLILAGAGSGKTRVLTNRVAYLIDSCGVAPWNIMAITFTNKAAGEMRSRVEKMVGSGSGVWIATFHSSCARILRRYIDRIGYETNFTIYDTDDSRQVMKTVIAQLGLNTKVYKERGILARISSAKNELIGPDELEAGAVTTDDRNIADAYHLYQQILKNNNALDFDDLLMKTVELFQTDPEVLGYYQEKLRYIMVDEYQDTNTAQFVFVKLLADRYRNICVVGDDDQSIYKFRGANIQNILNFEDSFPGARVIRLEQNYRSTQNILSAANDVIANNTARKVKRLWSDHGSGAKVHFYQFESANEEAAFVADDIRRKAVREGRPYSSFAVLYRTNAQSRLFEERFVAQDIPYKLVGGVNFYARKEIKDLLAYLKTVDNGMDDLACERIINVPKRGIGQTSVGKIASFAADQSISFYEAAVRADEISSLSSRARSKIAGFTNLIQKYRSVTDYLSVRELLEEIIRDTGYRTELEAEGTPEADGRIENIDELITKVADFESGNENATLSEFLQQVSLVADIDTVDDASDYVLLMTLHAAKGLEFDSVYMAGMEEGTFPGYLSINSGDPSELEEERRLCYVGITRAKNDLTMTASKTRVIRGELYRMRTSRFVREIPEELIETDMDTHYNMKKDSQSQILSGRTYGSPYGNGFRGRDASGESFAGGSNSSDRRKYGSAAYLERQRSGGAAPYQFKPRNYKVVRADHLDYTVGDRVLHKKFGEGTVQEIVEGGRDYEVTVAFDQAGVRKMFASFAKLKKLP